MAISLRQLKKLRESKELEGYIVGNRIKIGRKRDGWNSPAADLAARLITTAVIGTIKVLVGAWLTGMIIAASYLAYAIIRS